jgi:hypothetical protein
MLNEALSLPDFKDACRIALQLATASERLQIKP